MTELCEKSKARALTSKVLSSEQIAMFLTNFPEGSPKIIFEICFFDTSIIIPNAQFYICKILIAYWLEIYTKCVSFLKGKQGWRYISFTDGGRVTNHDGLPFNGETNILVVPSLCLLGPPHTSFQSTPNIPDLHLNIVVEK